MRYKMALLSLATAILASGCSFKLMPYEEDFACSKGKNTNICKSISEVYEMDEDDLKKAKCSKCDKAKKEPAKSAKKADLWVDKVAQEASPSKPALRKTASSSDSGDKNIPALQDATLNDKEEYIVIFKEEAAKNTKNANTKPVQDNGITNINGYVVVCVYRANIRQKPSCKAKIVRVAHRGERLYAYYEKDGWVKIDGGYIHRSIVRKETK